MLSLSLSEAPWWLLVVACAVVLLEVYTRIPAQVDPGSCAVVCSGPGVERWTPYECVCRENSPPAPGAVDD